MLTSAAVRKLPILGENIVSLPVVAYSIYTMTQHLYIFLHRREMKYVGHSRMRRKQGLTIHDQQWVYNPSRHAG